MNDQSSYFGLRALSLGGTIVLWQAAVLLFQPELLPGPLTVLQSLWAHYETGELLHHLGVTLGRVAISFLLAMLIGTCIGLLMGHFRKVDALLDSLVTIALNIPALVIIILCFIWFGLNEFAAVTAVVLNKTPTIIVTLREGGKAIDFKLLEVARAFRLPRWRTFLQVYLPQLYPYLFAATRAGLALVWKIVLVVELLGCSEGVGFQLGIFFQYFEITNVLAYTLAFVIVILLIEAVLIRPWEKAVMRWRA